MVEGFVDDEATSKKISAKDAKSTFRNNANHNLVNESQSYYLGFGAKDTGTESTNSRTVHPYVAPASLSEIVRVF